MPASIATATAIATTVVIALGYLALFALSIRLSIVDAREHRLPNKLVALTATIGLATIAATALLTADPRPLLRALACSAGAFLAYLALYLLTRTRNGAVLGAGDVKLAGALGLFLGFLGISATIAGIAAGFVLASMFSLVLIAAKRANRRSRVAFGPWMLAGAWLVIIPGLPDLLTSHYS